MAASMAGFSINDSLVKLASAGHNIGQVMFVRGLFASALLGLLAWRAGAFGAARSGLHPLVWVRIVGELGGTIFFLVALAHLPIATVSAVLQALPLAVTMGSALVLGERVGWRRWTAIAIGFAGVLIIVQPGPEGVNIYAISALCCVLFCTVRDLATSRIPRQIPSFFVSVTTAVSVCAFGALLVQPLGGWTPMPPITIIKLAGAAVALVVGYQCIVMATRTGDISAVAPFRYTALLWAILLGFLMFGDVPDVAMIAGALLIVGSGIYALYRDRVRGRQLVSEATSDPAMAPDGV